MIFGLTAIPSPALGQAALSVSGGAAPYDLSGTGTSAIAAIRVDVPVTDWVDVQAGPAFFWYTTQANDAVSMLIPEVGVVVGLARTPLYLAAGIGHTLLLRGQWPEELEVYAGIGAQIEDRCGWALRPELRLHNIDPWVGTIVELSFGVRRSFDRR